jgi:alkylation response protein AidB-like acyl-CoA dehydrogenase
VLDVSVVDAFLQPGHREVAARAHAFCGEHLAGLDEPEDDHAGRVQARELLVTMGEEGLYRYAFPPDHGGVEGGPSLRSCCLVREALAASSPLADAVFALQCLAAMPIALYGDAALQTRWLPAIARGEAMAGFAMTEPEAGSDVAGMRTTARRDGDTYVLDGEKTYISNAGLADVYVVFASTDRERGHRGLSAFVVPAETEGLHFSGAQILSAPHPLGGLRLEGCRVPAGARLGTEGCGFHVGMESLNRLRATVAAAACGMAARALEEARAHLLSRRQFGKPLAEQPLLRHKLAGMAMDLTAARLLTLRAAWEADRGGDDLVGAAAMAKAFATEAAQRVVDTAVQLLGGRGVVMGHPVEHLYRAVRALRIYEGTTEIQHLVIASRLL